MCPLAFQDLVDLVLVALVTRDYADNREEGNHDYCDADRPYARLRDRSADNSNSDDGRSFLLISPSTPVLDQPANSCFWKQSVGRFVQPSV